jgi:hypothetical protein
VNDQQLERLIGVQEDQIRSTRALEETLERMLPLLGKAAAGPSSNTSRATVNQNDRTPMWVCVVIVVALATALLSRESNKHAETVATQASITRLQGEIADIRADFREQRSVNQELRATDNAVRAYINTGILKPKANEVGKK